MLPVQLATTLPSQWDDPLFSAAAAQALLAQPGHVLFCHLEGGHLLARLLPEAPADILSLYVPASLRRQGRADQLMLALLAEARHAGCPALTLEVRAGNQAAIALYRKHGLQPLGRRPAYYQNPTEDALLYQSPPTAVKIKDA